MQRFPKRPSSPASPASPASLASLAFAAALVLGARSASAANVCVALDEANDTLEVNERKAAATVLRQALVANHHVVVTGTCEDTYTAGHVRLGKSMSVMLTSSKGSRTARAGLIDELPAIYDQLIRALDSGKDLGDDGVTSRKNATLDQAVPNRVQADNIARFTIGYGATLGQASAPGPTLGGGYRYELDRFAVDADINSLLGQKGAGATRGGFQAGIRGVYFFDPTASASLYAGAGAAFLLSASEIDHWSYSGSGLAGRASVGYEFLRESTIRMTVEVDAVLPVFKLTRDTSFGEMLGVPTAATGPASVYAPIIGLNFGIGWGATPQNITKVRLF